MLRVFHSLCMHKNKALVLATLQTSVTIRLHSVTGSMCNVGDNVTLISEYNRATVIDGSNQKKWKLLIFSEKEKNQEEVTSVKSTL